MQYLVALSLTSSFNIDTINLNGNLYIDHLKELNNDLFNKYKNKEYIINSNSLWTNSMINSNSLWTNSMINSIKNDISIIKDIRIFYTLMNKSKKIEKLQIIMNI